MAHLSRFRDTDGHGAAADVLDLYLTALRGTSEWAAAEAEPGDPQAEVDRILERSRIRGGPCAECGVQLHRRPVTDPDDPYPWEPIEPVESDHDHAPADGMAHLGFPDPLPDGDHLSGSILHSCFRVGFVQVWTAWVDPTGHTWGVNHVLYPDGHGSVWLGVVNNSARHDFPADAGWPAWACRRVLTTGGAR